MENKLVVKKELTKFQTIILYFFVYAFLGWLIETFYAYTVYHHFVNRGFLVGPLCPIYGYGAVILTSFLSKYKNHSLKLFVYSALIFSAFEYIAGFALDALFAERWWDYTNEFLNLNGRISILYSFVWGILALLLVNHIHPFIEKTIRNFSLKIPHIMQLLLLYICTFLYIADTIYSAINYLI